MREDNSRRITWIKSILCIMVIIVHCRNTDWFDASAAPWIAEAERNISEIFAKISVPGFFFFSGYLFFREYKPDRLLRKWKSRIFTLLIPFVLWGLIYYLIEILLRVFPFTAGAFAGNDVPVNASEFLQAAFNCKYHPVFWFLQYLIVYTLLAPAVWLLLKNRLFGFIFLAAVFGSVFFFSGIPLPGWTRTALLLLQYSPAFLTGSCCSIHLKAYFEDKNLTLLQAIPAGIAGIFLIGWEFVFPSLLSLELIRLLFGVILWFTLGIFHYRTPAGWMRYTFYLYAAHHVIARLVNMTVCIKVSSNMIVGGILYLLLPFFIVAFCTFTGRFFERFLPHIAFLLGIGERSLPKKNAGSR